MNPDTPLPLFDLFEGLTIKFCEPYGRSQFTIHDVRVMAVRYIFFPCNIIKSGYYYSLESLSSVGSYFHNIPEEMLDNRCLR